MSSKKSLVCRNVEVEQVYIPHLYYEHVFTTDYLLLTIHYSLPLNIKSEQHDVAVTHDIVLALYHLSFFLF